MTDSAAKKPLRGAALWLAALIHSSSVACSSSDRTEAGMGGGPTGGNTASGGVATAGEGAAGGTTGTGGSNGFGGTGATADGSGGGGGAAGGFATGGNGTGGSGGSTAGASGGSTAGGSGGGATGGSGGGATGGSGGGATGGSGGSATGGTGGTGEPGKLVLWYRQAATNWMTSALPIGNGRLGGMVFGGVPEEHIQFNDKTLWTGNTTTRGAYQSFGDLYVDFAEPGSVSNYRRELNLEQAISRVTYTVGSTTYHREYFSSYPDDVMVLRFFSDGATNLNFTVRLADSHGAAARVSNDRITIVGALDLLAYEAQVLVQNEGGTLTGDSEGITVADADAATVLLAAGTDYSPTAPTYVTGAGATGVHATVASQIAAAAAKSYETLKTNHLTDYQALFSRVALDLNDSRPAVPTNELQESYNGGAYDPFLDVLYYQYGRYLLISSSRGIAVPANLQGLWNDNNDPPWQCDIHSDINVQMNYWPAEVTNLSECHLPFLDYVYNEAMMHESWQGLASSSGNSGWTVMVQNNIFGYGDWRYTRPANAWYSMHMWQHYAHTRDRDFLSSRAYPVMKSACDFWLSRLQTDTDGTLVAPDEWSPEQTPDSEDGVAYAQQLIWDLFTNTIEASATLDVDPAYRSDLQAKLEQLDPGLRVGSWGQLREWKYTNDDPSNTHRHISHLIGLYPGRQISPLLAPSYSDAARVSLIARGDAGPGWSRAWKIAAWARLFDGNHAHALVQSALQKATVTVVDMNNGGGAYENLLDAHPPFQIDGNFGATAGMTEMLLQSQLGELILLPALPDAWSKGSVSGICAQGGFEVDMTWDEMRLTAARIESKSGGLCTVRNPVFSGTFSLVDAADGSAISYTQDGETIAFGTTAGSTYGITAGSAAGP